MLLASPYTDSAAALYYADDDYARLQSLLGGADLPTGPTAAPPTSAAGSPYVTATWLIHDVWVWRIDRIFLVGDEVWVVSETSTDGAALTGEGMYPGETGSASAVWHRPADPGALTALLAGRGLTPGAAAATVIPAAATQQATPIPSTSSSAWLWGIGGLLAGLIVGLGVGTALVRAAATRVGPTGPTAEPARMLPIA